MGDYKFDKVEQKVAFLMDNVPHARHNYLALLLTYWQMFDGIEIPLEIFKQIVEKGTQPETITRSRRRIAEQSRMKRYLELQRMAKEQVEVKAPLIQGGQPVDRKESSGP
jgi:hypothetical protein